MNRACSLRERILVGGVAVGIFGKINHPGVVEMIGNAGFDFVIFDTEHGNFSPVDVENMIRAAEAAGMSSVVRVRAAEAEDVLHALDSGADGVQIPSLRDMETAERVCRSAKYYPQGDRGLSGNQRSARYGAWDKEESYYQWANRESLVVVHVENLEMAAQVDKLCAIPQVDVVFVGPGDLSQALGKPGGLNDPEVESLIDGIFRQVLAAGKRVGIYCAGPAEVRRYVDRGATYLACGADVTCLSRSLGKLAAEAAAAARGEGTV